jgi:hypothetical protein
MLEVELMSDCCGTDFRRLVMAREVALRARAVYVDDLLWGAVQEKAAAEGRAVSAVVRELLGRWVARPPRKSR